ncbi:MAG: hypothetical protein WCH34_09475 [Bacteroidota bacterium]
MFLEEVFSNNPEKENNWDFFYYILRDANGNPVLSTFFTVCWVKDDMLASAEVSEKIEKERETNPYYLTSKNLMMGSLLTEGQHLWIDKQNPSWKQALINLLDLVWDVQEKQEAAVLLLRDFREDDVEMREFFMDQGFIKIETEENNFIFNEQKNTPEVFFEQLLDSKKKKYVFKTEVQKDDDLVNVSVGPCLKEEVPVYFKLYSDVKSKKLNLNTFDLPYKLFEKMCESPNWEVIKIELTENKKTLCIGLCGKNAHNYCPTIIGMNYSDDISVNVYKKMLYQAICRGLDLKTEVIHLGLGSSPAKHKLGAETIKQVAFIQIKDHYNMELINSMKS